MTRFFTLVPEFLARARPVGHPARGQRLGHRLGIRSNLPALPSIALGAAEANLLELTAAYSVFPRDGQRFDPYFVTAITNSRGDVLYEHSQREGQQVVTQDVAQNMSTMLQDVVLTGTGRRAALADRSVGGKPGTSQQH